MIDEPTFELTDESFKHHYNEVHYVPRFFNLKPTSFVFANNGRKSGVIVDIKFVFNFNESIKDLFERFNTNFGEYDKPDLPIVINDGGIGIISVSSDFTLLDWRYHALVNVLDAKLEPKILVEKALEKSKKVFADYIDFLATTKEIGKIRCIAKLSKGNGLEEKTLGEYAIINNYNEALNTLRCCLSHWDDLAPTKNDLLNTLEDRNRQLKREIAANTKIAKIEVDEKNITNSRLKVDVWELLNKSAYPNNELQWFLIKSKDGLDSLTQLYENITKYNTIVEQKIRLGEFRTAKDFEDINNARLETLSRLNKMSGLF